MNITIVNPSKIPALLYGGTERVIWYLGKEMAKLGHKVTYLVAAGSVCDFANVRALNNQLPLNEQIPENTDIVHFNFPVNEKISKPFVTTIHGNSSSGQEFDINTIFVSKNHAERHNSTSYVYNGLDWDDYGKLDLNKERIYFHFLANAAWKVKNLKGAMKICSLANEKLAVLGGNRLNFKMGFRLTLNTDIKFYGMVGGEKKMELLSKSKGLIFPVLWDEPFGLALIESMYFGCPVFGTPYGALSEIVNNESGFLSDKADDIAEAIKNIDTFDRKIISDYAVENFNSKRMAIEYLKRYEIVLSGKTLNETKPIYNQELNQKIFKFS
ncbi:MAG TPA: glycosyltransferase family 4 protein [Bacteroidales bacterium]|nr:glycosyltransferase family 4 protein [Bacteroidales bacterium]